MNLPDHTFQRLTPSDIDSNDTTYSISPDAEEPSPNLLDTMRQTGVFTPPLVKTRLDGRYVIIAGQAVLLAAQQLFPGKPLWCLVLAPETPETTTLTMLLHHGDRHERLSIIEQALFLKKSLPVFAERDVLDFLTLFGHKPQPRILRDILALLELEQPVIMALHQGLIHPRTGRKFAGLTAADQNILCRVIIEYKLGGSKQQKLVDMSMELAMRHGRDIKTILGELVAMDKRGEDNKPQRAAALLRELDKLYRPASRAAEENFKSWVAALTPPAGAIIQHTPAFEDDAVSLTLSFKNKEQLARAWGKIKEMLATDES